MNVRYNCKHLKPWKIWREKKINRQIKEGKNVPSLEVVEVALVQWNLVDKQYQQGPDFLYTFASNKSCTDLLNVEPNNFMFLEIHNTEFVEVINKFYRSKWQTCRNRKQF